MSEQPVEPVADMPEEIPAEELPLDEDKAAAGDARPPGPAMLKETWKQVETIGQAVGVALQGRGNVVMVRVNDDALRHLDMLVDAEITKSRSESAALLMKASKPTRRFTAKLPRSPTRLPNCASNCVNRSNQTLSNLCAQTQ